jgi:hypothetical protein
VVVSTFWNENMKDLIFLLIPFWLESFCDLMKAWNYLIYFLYWKAWSTCFCNSVIWHVWDSRVKFIISIGLWEQFSTLVSTIFQKGVRNKLQTRTWHLLFEGGPLQWTWHLKFDLKNINGVDFNNFIVFVIHVLYFTITLNSYFKMDDPLYLGGV